MIGDRWRDIEAGQRAGCKTIFIDYHYSEQNRSQPDVTVSSLVEAVDWILQQEKLKMRF
jgi:D-glycero-D-manno-heptose 1,7-bisphosphate phosphatase